MNFQTILGIWDGHDAGAAIVRGTQVVAAVNEERLSRRKLDVGFPRLSIESCIRQAGIVPSEIREIAVSTSDFSKTLTRMFPGLKEDYYLIRRRKKSPGSMTRIKKRAKYKLTEIGHSALTRLLSRRAIECPLEEAGLSHANVSFIEHHQCHAAAAAYFSGFDPCLAVTIDGIGDALSGTVSIYTKGGAKRIAELSGRNSFGIFFEHVTNLLNMRELEDEGKVMALATYAYPVDDRENPLMDFISVEGLHVECRYGSLKLYDELKKVLWRYPSEQFAAMAQRVLEVKVCRLVENCIAETRISDIALSGGVFSNIKLNMHIRLMPAVKRCFVFPHMGDGGLALGAACVRNREVTGAHSYAMNDIGWGPEYADDEIESACRESGMQYERCDDIEHRAAQLIADGHIVFWFQGRMEYGPRALGRRSILARPDSVDIRNELNLRLKMRVWYQPFCPSMLPGEAESCLENFDGLSNRFMTMGYMAGATVRHELAGVSSIDGSCRPHIVTPDDGRYERLVHAVKARTGRGIVLNTSFNVHGEPLVCSPADALATMRSTGNEYMAIGNYMVIQKRT